MSKLTKETFLKGGQLGYSKAEAEALIAEVNDGDKITLHCGKHMYIPRLDQAPLLQCEECWSAYIFLLCAQMPPHVREEFTTALQEFSHKTVENPLGYVQFEHPEITIEKG